MRFSHKPLSRKNPFSRTLLFRNLLPVLMFHGEEGGGGGGGKSVETLVSEAVESLLKKKGGDAGEALAFSVRETHAQRQRAERAEADLTAAKANVLDEATKTELEAYRGLGKTEEVKTKLAAGESAIAEASGLKRRETLAEAASLLGMKAGALWNSLMSGAEVEISGEGEARKVTVKDGDKPVDFETYAKSRPELTEAMSSLQTGAAGTAQVARQVVPFLKSAAAGGGQQVSLAERIRQEEKEKAGSKVTTTATAGEAPKTLEERLGMINR